MESEALVLFQQNTRGTGTRRFKVYRVTEFEPVDEFADRFRTYLDRNRFSEEVHKPHWLEADGPLTERTLAKIGEGFRQFSTFHLFAVTASEFQPFVAVPTAVDVIPALAEGVRLRVYDADDCDADDVPATDATPTLTIDGESFERPLSGPADEDGLLSLWHLFALQSATRLADDPSRGDDVGESDEPTALIPDGDSVIRIDLRSRDAVRRLPSHGLFVNYDAEAVPGDSLDAALTRVLKETATHRYRYASHLWAVRGGETEPTIAEDPDGYADERTAARGEFFYDVVDAFGRGVAPFSSGEYGGLLRAETTTRTDTFSLSERFDVDREDVVDELADATADYDPEYDRTAR